MFERNKEAVKFKRSRESDGLGVCVVRRRDRWKVGGSELREWVSEECPLEGKRRVRRKPFKEIVGSRQ